MKKEAIHYTAIIQKHPKFDAAYILFPFDVKERFGTNGLVKVKVRFDNKVDYRGSLANVGLKSHTLPLIKAIRNKLEKTFGDTVDVTLTRDTAPRIVIIPEDISQVLNKKKKLQAYFNSLSYTHQKEYVQWIESAKKEETRKTRLNKLVILLEEKYKSK